MAEESILLKVGIDENQIAKSEAAIVSARTELDKLKASNKALADEGKKNTVEFVKNETAIRDLTTTVRENERVLSANAKMQKSANGSIRELRASVSRLKEEYVELSAEERENAQVGGLLQKELLAQTEALKALEAEIGVTSRNVGNYTGSILEAVDGSGLFAKAQQALAGAQAAATAATQAGTIATQSFGKALIATGIGAFIIILGSLLSYLTRTQEGMDLVSKATAAVGTFVAVVTDEFSRLGKQIFDNVVPAFKGLGDIIGGILTLDFDQVKQGVEAVTAAAKNIDGINIIELGANAAKAAGDAAKLEGEMQGLVRAEKALEVERAKSRATIEALKFIAEDTSKTAKEREEATKKALGLEQGLLSKSISLQEDRLRIIKAQNGLSSSTDEDLNRAFDAEIALDDLRQESTTKQIELNNKLNGIRKEQADKATAERATAKAEREADDAEELAAAKEQADKATAERATAKAEREADDAEELAAAKAKQEELNAQYQEAITQRAADTDNAIRESINSVKTQFADGLIDLETYQAQLDQVEALALETRKAALLGQLEENKNNAIIDAETRIAIEADLQAQLRALADETATAGVAAKQAELKGATEVANAKMAAEDAVLNAAKAVFGEQSAAGKIAASFQALIDTYRGANLAIATIPPPFGQIVAAATVAQGLSNVAKINSKPAPKFADGGGIEVSGPSHAGGGVDVALGGQTVANVEGGEGLFVMKKSAFQSIKALSDYNQNHGGRSWFGGGKRFLADGGAISRSGTPTLDRRALIDSQQTFEQAISGLTIVTKVSDIDRAQGDAKRVSVQADLR